MKIPAHISNIVTTSTTEYWLEDGKLMGNVLPDAKMDVQEVVENAEKRAILLDVNKPIPLILDITKIDKITKEARGYSRKATNGISAIAMIIDSGLSRIIGNYALMLDRPAIPTKLFSSREDAEEWLEKF